jgi:hypothetical protein
LYPDAGKGIGDTYSVQQDDEWWVSSKHPEEHPTIGALRGAHTLLIFFHSAVNIIHVSRLA